MERATAIAGSQSEAGRSPSPERRSPAERDWGDLDGPPGSGADPGPHRRGRGTGGNWAMALSFSAEDRPRGTGPPSPRGLVVASPHGRGTRRRPETRPLALSDGRFRRRQSATARLGLLRCLSASSSTSLEPEMVGTRPIPVPHAGTRGRLLKSAALLKSVSVALRRRWTGCPAHRRHHPSSAGESRSATSPRRTAKRTSST